MLIICSTKSHLLRHIREQGPSWNSHKKWGAKSINVKFLDDKMGISVSFWTWRNNKTIENSIRETSTTLHTKPPLLFLLLLLRRSLYSNSLFSLPDFDSKRKSPDFILHCADMALNPQLFPNGMPVPFVNEMFVLARVGVEFEIDKVPGSVFSSISTP